MKFFLDTANLDGVTINPTLITGSGLAKILNDYQKVAQTAPVLSR